MLRFMRRFLHCWELAAEAVHNGLQNLLRWRVLPKTNDRPASHLKRLANEFVTLGVPFQFGTPVAVVSCRDLSMVRASVPKAAIDEHG